ncbi:MAG: thiol:disulfide interchange protein DsbA/DsbL [Gammaproteobacteria bacterium]|nr:thiol:disulfide interchange protein DsbA/DsbL [Gammaproteobacteria bacterium]
MKFKLFMAVLLTALLSNVATAEINEGFDYKLVSPVQPTITKSKIEVIELFWYGCPHCFHFEPHLKEWLANKPDNVVFYRVPAVFNPTWALHARAFYTAKTLGLFDNGKVEFHEAMFDEIHKKNKHLHNKKDIEKIFSRFGISAEDFNNTFDSFAVNTKVNRAVSLSKRYQLDGVPTLIVNGKYRTDGPMAGGRKGMIKVLNFLVKKETKK